MHYAKQFAKSWVSGRSWAWTVRNKAVKCWDKTKWPALKLYLASDKRWEIKIHFLKWGQLRVFPLSFYHNYKAVIVNTLVGTSMKIVFDLVCLVCYRHSQFVHQFVQCYLNQINNSGWCGLPFCVKNLLGFSLLISTANLSASEYNVCLHNTWCRELQTSQQWCLFQRPDSSYGWSSQTPPVPHWREALANPLNTEPNEAM